MREPERTNVNCVNKSVRRERQTQCGVFRDIDREGGSGGRRHVRNALPYVLFLIMPRQRERRAHAQTVQGKLNENKNAKVCMQ